MKVVERYTIISAHFDTSFVDKWQKYGYFIAFGSGFNKLVGLFHNVTENMSPPNATISEVINLNKVNCDMSFSVNTFAVSVTNQRL